MVIGIASDHAGFDRKTKLLEFLRKKNYDVIDYGTDSNTMDDYNDYCEKLCKHLSNKDIDYGILICKTGVGMSICANKIKGIYCAKADNKREATLCRKHNDANVLALSSQKCFFKTKSMVLAFLHTPFLNEERFVRRINKVKKLENK